MLARELPGLRLDWLTVEGRRQESPRAVKQRLHALAGRYRGADVIAMRTKPVPRAYRTFYRQIGLDPDVTRVPSEQAAVDRLLHGGFRSVDVVADAVLVAVLETGVPVWALDARWLHAGGPGIRTAAEGEQLGAGDRAEALPAGTLVVADAEHVYARLFGPVAAVYAVTAATERVALLAVGVDGVPAIHIEEALWLAADLLRARER